MILALGATAPEDSRAGASTGRAGRFDGEPVVEFSADIVTRDADGTQLGAIGKLHVAGHKVRIDAPDTPGGFYLVDPDAGTALFIRPAQRVFTNAGQSSLLTQIFVPVNPDDPCPQWEAAARLAGEAFPDGIEPCVREQPGPGKSGATPTYRVNIPYRQNSQRRVDPDLRFPVSAQSADGTRITLEQIRLEAQPVNLFTLPADYARFDPRDLLERIRHSDAWVEPPE